MLLRKYILERSERYICKPWEVIIFIFIGSFKICYNAINVVIILSKTVPHALNEKVQNKTIFLITFECSKSYSYYILFIIYISIVLAHSLQLQLQNFFSALNVTMVCVFQR